MGGRRATHSATVPTYTGELVVVVVVPVLVVVLVVVVLLFVLLVDAR